MWRCLACRRGVELPCLLSPAQLPAFHSLRLRGAGHLDLRGPRGRLPRRSRVPRRRGYSAFLPSCRQSVSRASRLLLCLHSPLSSGLTLLNVPSFVSLTRLCRSMSHVYLHVCVTGRMHACGGTRSGRRVMYARSFHAAIGTRACTLLCPSSLGRSRTDSDGVTATALTRPGPGVWPGDTRSTMGLVCWQQNSDPSGIALQRFTLFVQQKADQGPKLELLIPT